jgi:hypothetical protein
MMRRNSRHYARAAFDVEFDFGGTLGFQEIEGVHNRGDFDSRRHQEYSGKKLEYFDQPKNKRYVPYVIETSVGADRVTLAALVNAYREEAVEGEDEGRVVLGLHPSLAPIKAAVFALTKKDGMPEMAHRIAGELRRHFPWTTTRRAASASATAGRTRWARRSASPSTAIRRRTDGDGARPRHAEAGPRRRRLAARAPAERSPDERRLSIERLRREGEAFMEELSREYFLAHAGLKASAELQPIYAKHRGDLGPTRSSSRASVHEQRGGSEERRSARLLLDWQVESQSARELAALDEREIAWEGTPWCAADGARSRTSARRSSWPTRPTATSAHDRGGARALVERELAPMKRERFQRERDITESVGLADGYNATWELLNGVSLSALRDECAQFLRDTQAMWDEVCPAFVKRVLGMKIGETTRADALALFRGARVRRVLSGRGHGAVDPPEVREMGVDPEAGGRVRFDTGEREGKRSRAFCAPVRVPEEVYLVLRPHGGQTDWQTFLHELGHALHFANMRPDHPMEYRWMGDNSVTEGYAMLFDHLMQDGGWLRAYTGSRSQRCRTFCAPRVRGAALPAALLREADLRDAALRRRRAVGLAARSVRRDAHGATTFRYSRADAFVDVDPRFYAARYLRAWQLQALITETLVERTTRTGGGIRARAVDRAGAVRRGAARAGAGAGGARVGEGAVVRAARAEHRADAGMRRGGMRKMLGCGTASGGFCSPRPFRAHPPTHSLSLSFRSFAWLCSRCCDVVPLAPRRGDTAELG